MAPFLKLLDAMGVNKGKKLYAYAKTQIGQNKCGRTPIEFGCASTVNNVFRECFGNPIGGMASTSMMFQALKANNRFMEPVKPDLGDIIISPTGQGHDPSANGHVGIYSDHDKIMSNNSATGIFDEHLDVGLWINHYTIKGGFPIYFFRLVV